MAQARTAAQMTRLVAQWRASTDHPAPMAQTHGRDAQRRGADARRSPACSRSRQ